MIFKIQNNKRHFMEPNLVTTIIFNFHIHFLRLLTPSQFNNLYLTNKEINNIIKTNGGFCKLITWDGRQNFGTFITRLYTHSADTIDYLEKGWNNCNIPFFDWVDYNPRILVLREPINTHLTTKYGDRIEYLFLVDNNEQTLTLCGSDFPNLKFIGCYKSSVKTSDSEPFLKNTLIMKFRDPESVNIMSSKSYTNLASIFKVLKQIYPYDKLI